MTINYSIDDVRLSISNGSNALGIFPTKEKRKTTLEHSFSIYQSKSIFHFIYSKCSNITLLCRCGQYNNIERKLKLALDDAMIAYYTYLLFSHYISIFD